MSAALLRLLFSMAPDSSLYLLPRRRWFFIFVGLLVLGVAGGCFWRPAGIREPPRFLPRFASGQTRPIRAGKHELHGIREGIFFLSLFFFLLRPAFMRLSLGVSPAFVRAVQARHGRLAALAPRYARQCECT